MIEKSNNKHESQNKFSILVYVYLKVAEVVQFQQILFCGPTTADTSGILFAMWK